jgi:hypothetical protein
MKEERSIARIYISYPYSDEPGKRIRQVKKIVREIMKHRDGFVLFIPHFAFHAFNKDYGVQTADEHCLELLAVSDMLCVCLPKSEPLSRGMKQELVYARSHSMPIVYLEDFLKDPKGALKERRKLVQAVASE